MWASRDRHAEPPLTRESRARLSFRELLVLYLDPFALFQDASSGPDSVRQRARTYNRRMRWMLLRYLRRWLAIGASLFLGIALAEAFAPEISFFVVPAVAFAIGGCIAAAVVVSTLAAYLMLGLRN
jgi:hypothetical protein